MPRKTPLPSKVLPLQLNDLLSRVARESAKMSWPGQMQPILHAKTKAAVEDYFGTTFLSHVQFVWTNPTHMRQIGYDIWHKQRAQDLGRFLQQGNHVK